MINITKRNVQIVSSYVSDDICWNTPQEFVQLLTQVLTGTIDAGNNEDFILVGHETPSPDQRNKIWAKFSINRRWLGFFAFVKGAWRKLYHYNSDDIIWKAGDSRNIPDGFVLIDNTTSTLTPAVRNAIVDQYVETSPGSGIYNYFAVLYVGY